MIRNPTNHDFIQLCFLIFQLIQNSFQLFSLRLVSYYTCKLCKYNKIWMSPASSVKWVGNEMGISLYLETQPLVTSVNFRQGCKISRASLPSFTLRLWFKMLKCWSLSEYWGWTLWYKCFNRQFNILINHPCRVLYQKVYYAQANGD